MFQATVNSTPACLTEAAAPSDFVFVRAMYNTLTYLQHSSLHSFNSALYVISS